MCSWDSLILETASPRTRKPKVVNESLPGTFFIFQNFFPDRGNPADVDDAPASAC